MAWYSWNGWAFSSPIDLASLNKALLEPNEGEDHVRNIDRWAAAHSGYDAYATLLRITVQGISQPVVITGMRAQVYQRGTPPTSVLVSWGKQGSADPIPISIDLDSDEPRARYFTNKYISVQPNENVVIDLTATATRTSVTWDLLIDLVVAGEHRTLTIKHEGGRHFRTAPLLGKPQSDYPPIDLAGAGYDAKYCFNVAQTPSAVPRTWFGRC